MSQIVVPALDCDAAVLTLTHPTRRATAIIMSVGRKSSRRVLFDDTPSAASDRRSSSGGRIGSAACGLWSLCDLMGGKALG